MAYVVKISGSTEIKIDRDELAEITKAIESGARLIKVRSGIFNPSFITDIQPDYKRLEGLSALDKLPDMFDRISNMASTEDIISERLEAPKEVKKTPEEISELLERGKPDFLKNEKTATESSS